MRFVEMAHIGFRYTDRDDLCQFVLDTSGIFEEASIQFFSCLPSCGSFYTLHRLFKRGRYCSNFRPSISLPIQRAFPEVALATKFLAPVDSHCYC